MRNRCDCDSLSVISGPAIIGNCFGRYGTELESGLFAIVRHGEYSNGGRGPYTADSMMYGTRAAAEAAMAKMLTDAASR